MPGHDIIVIGASAGGVEALSTLAAGLPANLPAALFVVLHIPPHAASVLPQILSRAGTLPASHPIDGQAIQHGRIYVAPPDFHLLMKRGHIHLAGGPRENGHRPAVDPLFRTAARIYGPRVVGVVLSGNLDDGTAGLQAVKLRGGVAIAQEPGEAVYSGMPRSACENVGVDWVLPVSQIAAVLARLAKEQVEEKPAGAVSKDMEIESDMAELDIGAAQSNDRPGKPSQYACPECGGALWELSEGNLLRFRCRVGHAFSAESLLAEQSEALEEALWTAFRALRESAALARRMAGRAGERGLSRTVANFEKQAQEAEQRAEIIQQVLVSQDATPVEEAALSDEFQSDESA
ncbi:chemotaxis protein CheB [Kamptonema formosum]|uniref:chemotaxis protein CheB n=1 Tax=Kamptonema formosum TaxID=331992 RepID=UPI00034C25CE|nr:chemotaxis protein CheB [Oscillatoria sp. PCC 10802]